VFGEEYQPYLSISFADYMEYVAIYHRFNGEDIYENEATGFDKIVFTTVDESNMWIKHLAYEIKDNYVNTSILSYSEAEGEVEEKIIAWIKETYNAEIANVLAQNKSLFFASDSTITMFEQDVISVYLFMNIAECSNEYFENDAFYDFIDLHNVPMMDFLPYFYGEYENLDITSININASFDTDGNLIDIEREIIVFEEDLEDETTY
jgi:hypothetical protein